MLRGAASAMGLRTSIFSLAVLCGCQADDLSARAVWLRDTLVLDNQTFLELDREGARGKFAKMGRTPFEFARGTAPQYARDFAQPAAPVDFASDFRSARSRDVALVGDPHPENVGTFRSGSGEIVVDYNDFDAARFGPYDFDVRRLALGVYLLFRSVDQEVPQAEAEGWEAVRATAFGYADEIAALASGDTGAAAGDLTLVGKILAERLDAAATKSGNGELESYTTIVNAERAMVFGDVKRPVVLRYGDDAQRVYEDTVIAVDASTRTRIEALIAAYVLTVRDPRRLGNPVVVKGVSQRLGAGVSSYPNLRYYVLVEGNSPSVDDDVLLELKQVVDAVPLPGFVELPGAAAKSNGRRVVEFQRALQSSADNDPLLGFAELPPYQFRITGKTDFQRGVAVDRIIENVAAERWVATDLIVFAEACGRLLARAHGRAPKRDGTPGLAAIAEALGQNTEAFVDETEGFARDYGPQLERDYEIFVDLLSTFGTDLGYPQ